MKKKAEMAETRIKYVNCLTIGCYCCRKKDNFVKNSTKMQTKPPFTFAPSLIIIILMILLFPVSMEAQSQTDHRLQATSQPYPSSKHASTRILRGDVNFDGERSLIDIMLLVDYILNEKPTFELKYGDLDDDGEISLIDITILVDIILGGTYIDPEDPSFPIGGSEGGDPSGGL